VRRGTDQPRPLSYGYFFSLGHSTIVVAIGIGIIIAERTVFSAVSNNSSGLEQFGGLFGTIVSASFLFLIGLLNLVVLAGIVRVFRSMRRGDYDEAELERQLQNRGLFYRFFGRWMGAISKEWQMYPVGVIFGMGFDTATEVALLATTALYASQHVPWYAIICLPILFTAGMALMDTTDGIFMNMAYGWAFLNPVRKVYYNLTITGLSVAICFFIGGIETLGLLPQEIGSLSQHHGFWGFVYNFDINKAGFVIVGLFVVTWVAALVVWRYGRVEERWSARLQAGPAEAS
jgi:high-affinity nickel-transport protein